MPLLYQKIIMRADLQRNRGVLYLFGDNLAQEGFGGQAKEMRGEPNAIGIPTKHRPSMEDDAFFTNADICLAMKPIRDGCHRAEKHLRAGGVVVIPLDGLGTGLAQLATRAPYINDYLRGHLDAMRVISEMEMK